MFQPSLEGDSIEILIDENLVILSAGSITCNSFESHCRHKYSNFWVADGISSSFAGIQSGLKYLRLYWCEKSTASSSEPTPANCPNRLSIQSPLPAHSHNWQADRREGPRSRNEWEPTELKTSALPPEPYEPSVTLAKGTWREASLRSIVAAQSPFLMLWETSFNVAIMKVRFFVY